MWYGKYFQAGIPWLNSSAFSEGEGSRGRAQFHHISRPERRDEGIGRCDTHMHVKRRSSQEPVLTKKEGGLIHESYINALLSRLGWPQLSSEVGIAKEGDVQYVAGTHLPYFKILRF